MAQLVGADRLLSCIVEWGGTNLGPGRVVRDTIAPMVVGELDGSERPRTQLLARCLEAVGDVRLTRNVRGQIWSKLLVNSAFTGLSAVSGLRYGGVAQHPDGRAAVYAIWAEGFAVAWAEEITLDRVLDVEPRELIDRDDAALARMMAIAGNTKPSMLQDLEQGRPTEVDVVNGGVAQRARAHRIATPFNDRVVELVHAMERGERAPAPRELTELVAVARSDGDRPSSDLGQRRHQPVVAQLLGRRAVQHPVAVVAAADRAGPREVADRAGHRRAVSADEVGEALVAERQGQDDAVGVHAAPALGEVPEREQQPVVDALMVGDGQATARWCARRVPRLKSSRPSCGQGTMRTTRPWSSTARRVGSSTIQPTSAWTCEPSSSQLHGRMTSPGPMSSTQRRPRTSTSRLSSPSTMRKPRWWTSASRATWTSHSPGESCCTRASASRRARSSSSASSSSARSGSASTRLMTLLPMGGVLPIAGMSDR